MESYGTLIGINLYVDPHSVIWDFFMSKEILTNVKQCF